MDGSLKIVNINSFANVELRKNNISSKNAFMSSKKESETRNTNFVTRGTLRNLVITPLILNICYIRTSTTIL